MKRIQYKLDIHLALLVCIFIALVLAGVVAYQYWLLNSELKSVEGKNLELTNQLQNSKEENTYLFEQNTYRQSIIDSFNGQIQGIASTVGTLEKLSQTDKELLKSIDLRQELEYPITNVLSGLGLS